MKKSKPYWILHRDYQALKKWAHEIKLHKQHCDECRKVEKKEVKRKNESKNN